MSRFDYKAGEVEIEKVPLHRIIKGILSIILFLHRNPGFAVTRVQLFKKFKELMR